MFDSALLSLDRKSNDSHTLPQTPTPVGQKKNFWLVVDFFGKSWPKVASGRISNMQKKAKKNVKKLSLTWKLT